MTMTNDQCWGRGWPVFGQSKIDSDKCDAACSEQETDVTHFADRLAAAVKRCANPVLVGLDPRWESLPESLRSGVQGDDLPGMAAAYTLFCRGVIDVVAPLVAVVKPQAAFFEQLGPAGMQSLWDVIRYAREKRSAGDRGWQAKRHRFDGNRLCASLLGGQRRESLGRRMR